MLVQMVCQLLHVMQSGVSLLEISLTYNERSRFTVKARRHRLVLDQPAEDGATDQGMSPAELLLASLGGCVGQHAAQYLNAGGFSSKGLAVTVRTQPSARPLHLGSFRVEVTVPGLSELQMRALEKSFPAGLVQNAIRLENDLQVAVLPTPAKKTKR
jgi:putative redox protein